MPTPVSIARQCLTQESSHALDEAVLIANRRSHTQTTSLHLISAFLALPSSSLRDACARVRSTAYAPKYQFKALELSFTSALDRLSSSQPPQDEPPISNSLMAAIKRSQANQRRNPESFHLYQQQLQSQSQSQSSQQSLNCVKVELQNLVLSILDDPIVSRVFAEVGFRSCDVKLAILRPLPPLGKFHRSRRAPLFLCNLTDGDENSFSSSSNFNFPFMDDSFRRIGEVLGRKKERNPLLIGVSAVDTLQGLPGEVFGLKLVCIEKEISMLQDRQGLDRKFEELEESIVKCSGGCGAGVVVSFGDLGLLLDDCCVDGVSYVVAQLSRLLEVYREKLWLIGAAVKYEIYLKFLMRFPSIEKDWDLQLLPITSVKSPVGVGGAGFQARPQSLTESFVPFGGFFSTTSDLRSSLTGTPQPIFRCHLCNEKYEQEVSAFMNGGYTPSVAYQCHESLPPWLQNSELGSNRGLDMTKAPDDGPVFRAKVTGLQNKWNDICRRLHHNSPTSKAESHCVGVHVIPATVGLPFIKKLKDNANHISIDGKINGLPLERDCGNAQPSMGLHKSSSPPQRNPQIVASEATSGKACELDLNDSKSESPRTESIRSSPCPLSGSSIPNEHVSPSSIATVATDLGLGTLYASTNKEPKKLTVQTHRGWLQESSGCSPVVGDVRKVNISDPSIQSPTCTAPDCSEQIDLNDLKSLWRCLLSKVGRQNEAMQAISQAIVRCRTRTERRRGASLKRDLWFNFVGLDRVAKRRTALALAEILFGSKQNIISLDLSSQDGMTPSSTIFGCGELDGYDIKFRGKMAVDYIAEEIRKKPLSIVFLENINKADMLLQKSLSQAIKTGKLPDSRGRETSISNTVFIATSSVTKDTKFEKICTKFSEERMLEARSLEIQMLIGGVREGGVKITQSNVLITPGSNTPGHSFANKRKLVESNDTVEQCETYGWLERAHKTPKFLDLNLPVEDTEAINSDNDSCESDTISENTEAWLEEFLGKMDGTAVFKPFDFDALANRLLKEISVVSRKTLGSDCLLEIDSKVMEQILAAAWISDRERAVEDWVEQILGKSFAEARQRYSITGQSVLKLVSSDDCYVKEQASGVCLPSRIILN